MPKRLLLLCLLSVISLAGFAQANKSGIVKGKLINSATKQPFHDIRVTLPDMNAFTTSGGDGVFSISEVPYGSQRVIVGGGDAQRDTLTVNVSKELTDLGDILLKPNDRAATTEAGAADAVEIPTIAFEESNTESGDEGAAAAEGAQNVYGFSQDPFLYNATLKFISYRYRPRGLNSSDIQINGISVQDQETGFTSTLLVGGLNDVFRDRITTYGLSPSEYAFGGLKGSTYIASTAADQRKGTDVSFYNSNRSFHDRVMATYSSGVNDKGWAYSVSGSYRWAKEGYVPGTFYSSYSLYGAVSKVTKKGQLNLTAFTSPTIRGKASTATDELFTLAGTHYYNADWGYQNGVKRNANVSDVSQPVFIANYTYKPDDKTRWNTAIGYEFGKNKNSSLDYYNGYSPYPNYYRNLPSYYLNLNPPVPGMASEVQQQLQSNPSQLQIDWNDLYQANYLNAAAGHQSVYVLSNRVDDLKKASFNTQFEHVQNEHLTLFGGLSMVSQSDENYKQLADLLGGSYFVNYNQFASQQSLGNPNYLYNNLNDTSQIIKKGDKYGYDYSEHVNVGNLWGQAAYTYNRVDFFAAANAGYNSFFRDGFMRNGVFPDNSYGKSATHSFLTGGVKAGLTFKLDPRNSFFVNASYTADAPTVANTYISVSTRDFTVANPTTQKNKSFEIGYNFKSPKLTARITGYATDITDATIIKRFYNDDPAIYTFVNYVMTNVAERSLGLEGTANYRIDNEWSLTGLVAYGQAFYANNPSVAIYQDNDPTLTSTSRQVYIKDYYLGIGPQSVYSLAVNYRPRNYWNGSISFNYQDRSYVDINPDRRTQEAVDLVQQNSPQWKSILGQEKLNGAFTIDLHVSKSLEISKYIKKLDRKTTAYFQLGIVNLLNNQDIKVLGYEQLRYDYTYRNPAKFPNTYEYGLGINYYASVNIRF